ncbi:type IV secretory system conjugative DNA transfer family protein [Bariatricus sp. HCP28S3_D3]|uniref:type IV secretory system conjugative DNA transfer family protein n=1 Tax=Bariatricus sp. HCP28S3_D3 TaxID=3438901 RepID=UPI003F89B90B
MINTDGQINVNDISFDEKMLLKADGSNDTDRLILGDGENCIFSSNSQKTGLNNNILVIGTSGCGKTVSIIEPRILETFNRSLIATVTKRRIVKKYSVVMKKRGYNVWDLNFVHPNEGNCGYDPLMHIGSYNDITFLARSIVLANPQKAQSNADPYWDDGATSLFSAEISYVLMTKDNPTFADVLDFHNKLTFEERSGVISTNYDRKFDYLAEKDPSCFAVSCWKSFKQLPVKTASCIFSALNTTIDSIFTSELKEMFRMKKMVDLEKLASEKTVLFITTSPVNSSLNSFISSFYGTLFKDLFEYAEEQPDGKLPVPVDVLADDFATGCPVHMFEQYVSIFREKGLSVTALIQSESQLSSLYGSDKATTIINNCDTIVFLGSMDLETGRSISVRANRPLEDVLYMPIGSEIIFRRGMKPIFTKRYNIFQNEMYKKATAAYEKHVEKEMSQATR